MIKRRRMNQIENLTPTHKSLESKGQMKSNWGAIYTIENIFSKAIRYFPRIFKIDLNWERFVSKVLGQ